MNKKAKKIVTVLVCSVVIILLIHLGISYFVPLVVSMHNKVIY